MGLTVKSLPQALGVNAELKGAQETNVVSFRSSCQPECLLLQQRTVH